MALIFVEPIVNPPAWPVAMVIWLTRGGAKTLSANALIVAAARPTPLHGLIQAATTPVKVMFRAQMTAIARQLTTLSPD